MKLWKSYLVDFYHDYINYNTIYIRDNNIYTSHCATV